MRYLHTHQRVTKQKPKWCRTELGNNYKKNFEVENQLEAKSVTKIPKKITVSFLPRKTLALLSNQSLRRSGVSFFLNAIVRKNEKANFDQEQMK